MGNINDIFEGKKSCLSLLNESSLYGYSITNQGMDYDQCMDYHTEMIKESTQEILQWEADWYKNDLIIEEAMYENFIEEDIKEMIMEGLGDAIRSGIEKIKALLNKLKEWMLSVLRAIKDIFSATEDAAEKAEKKIKDKMKKGELSASDKVEALVYKDIDAAGRELGNVMEDIGNIDDAFNESSTAKEVFDKQMWLKGIGVSSVSELLEKTRKIFLPSQDKKSITIDQAIKLGSNYITKAEVHIKKLESFGTFINEGFTEYLNNEYFNYTDYYKINKT